MVNVQRLIRDRHLSPDEAERYRQMREEPERDKENILAKLGASSAGFLSWEELAEFRTLVKSKKSPVQHRLEVEDISDAENP
jgi:hypothetical protein